jgi:hypothetical protein
MQTPPTASVMLSNKVSHTTIVLIKTSSHVLKHNIYASMQKVLCIITTNAGTATHRWHEYILEPTTAGYSKLSCTKMQVDG